MSSKCKNLRLMKERQRHEMSFMTERFVDFLIQREVMRSCLVTDNWKERISEIPRAKRMANKPWAVDGERVRFVGTTWLVPRTSQLQIPIPCVSTHARHSAAGERVKTKVACQDKAKQKCPKNNTVAYFWTIRSPHHRIGSSIAPGTKHATWT